MRTVRVGNGCGFWGDNLDAPIELVRHGRLDYLTLEYLAELTMSILALQMQRDPAAGYAADFLDVLSRLGPSLVEQPGLRVVTNAGGMNPSACATRALAALRKHGLPSARVAVVSGDDLLPRLDELLAAGEEFRNLDTGAPLAEVRDRVVSASAYLGSRPVADALALGARVVVTGRIADAALTLGPLMHEFGWREDDWDLLAAGTVAGHLIECGAQATGGLWCNWRETDLAEVGYPLVEMCAGGDFVLTKPPGTGGTVNRETATEQLLYEVGDPAAYLTPDVVADFTTLSVEEVGPDRVAVGGARGRPATPTYKASIAYRDGYQAAGTLVIAGPDAPGRARACARFLTERLKRAGALPEHWLAECLGAGDSLPGVLPTVDAPEVVLRVAARDSRKAVLDRFAREFAPLVTSGPPGVTGYTTGRPSVREVLAFWPALVSKSRVRPSVRLVEE